MNKLGKVLAVLSIATVATAGAVTMAACNGDNGKTGEAYGLVHSGGYVGYATVTVKDNKVTDATLTEVCLPTQVKNAEGGYYASVTYGSVTMTYDEGDSTYKVGTKTIKEYLQTEANCKAYYEAVIGNKIKADGAEGIMTKAALSKEENGYWTRGKDDEGNWGRVNNPSTEEVYVNNQYSRWKQNRDATVNYVKEHGVANLLKLEKATTKSTDVTEGSEVTYWMDGTISTGATWTDFNTVKDGSTSYAQLIVNAYLNAGGEYTFDGEYSYTSQWGDYGVKVHVAVKDGKITKVTYDADTDSMHNITPSWPGHDVTAAAVDTYLAKFVGKTLAEVNALEVTTNATGVPQTATWIFDGLSYENDGDTVETGATQTAGRFILAIQDAIKGL